MTTNCKASSREKKFLEMAAQWSGEFVVADYGDLQASAMAVDCLGSWAVLAGRRNLTLVNLEEPTDKVTKTARQSKWDISCVQWNPHASHAHLFVTACNQRLDLYSWKDSSTNRHCSMKAHSRTVSDIDWSPFDVNVIASCSVDTFTYLWDVRDPKKPAVSFQTVSGASQVKWNKVTNNTFATAHEGDVRLWDPRKGNAPLLYIAAHLSKIHGLDWCPQIEHHLATSSQDCTVKFWDTKNPRKAEGMLNSGSPVWRARYTPFGHGLITVVVPQLRRGVNSLYLWNIGNQFQPVHQFVGHTDVVLEFQWRRRPPGHGDHHLVTWSKDQSLRIWKIDSNLQKLCGDNILDSSLEMDSTVTFEIGTMESKELEQDSFPSPQSSMVGDATEIAIQQPRTLQQEFSLVNMNIPNVTIEEMDPIKRTCSVMAYSGTNKISLVMSFPANYPDNAAPSFDFQTQPLSKGIQKKLIKVLNETSQRHVKRHANCLEPCLRQLAAALEVMNVEERKTPDSDPYTSKRFFPISGIGAFIDSSIPFPRTSGARFCSAGYLVCFGRSREAKRAPGSSEITPKALSELAAYASRARVPREPVGFPTFGFSRSPPNASTEPVTISAFYMYKEKKHRPRNKLRNTKDGSDTRMKDTDKCLRKPKVGPVQVYDINRLLTIHKQLGENYKIDTDDIPAMCLHNGTVSASVGRRDLVQLWSLVALMSSPKLASSPNPEDGPPWGRHPFGRRMLKSLMDYYCSVYDVQTLAMLVCIFWDRQDGQRLLQHSASRTSIDYVPANYNPYHTVSSGSNLLKNWTATTLKVKRSNSWSFEDSFEDYRFVDEKDNKEKVAEAEKKQHENNCKLLDPTSHVQYDLYLKVYADILYRWGLRNQCNHVLKHTTMAPDAHKGVEFAVRCSHCLKDVRGAQCASCKMAAFQCAICHLGVRGASNFCLACGHGGHTMHMMEWFQVESVCPTGCGCQCLINSELRSGT
ncbi:hypothetical protein ScPMuIL_001376 [Solemya velum]